MMRSLFQFKSRFEAVLAVLGIIFFVAIGVGVFMEPLVAIIGVVGFAAVVIAGNVSQATRAFKSWRGKRRGGSSN